MKPALFKTLWGHAGTFAQAIAQAKQRGFDGLEAVPPALDWLDNWRAQLNESGLLFIAEIPTTGDYAPRREASLSEHLSSLRDGLEAAKILGALKVNCVGGCDAWSLGQSVAFFGEAMELAQSYELPICFETHRSRSLYVPWQTREILLQLPPMRLTCDFSHWCVVLERLPDSEAEAMRLCFERASHIHARVGWAQGAQVNDPRAPQWTQTLEAHQSWWSQIWDCQRHNNNEISTMTPEWGPDGYAQTLPYTQMPVADIDEINAWMASQQRARFEGNYATS